MKGEGSKVVCLVVEREAEVVKVGSVEVGLSVEQRAEWATAVAMGVEKQEGFVVETEAEVTKVGSLEAGPSVEDMVEWAMAVAMGVEKQGVEVQKVANKPE